MHGDESVIIDVLRLCCSKKCKITVNGHNGDSDWTVGNGKFFYANCGEDFIIILSTHCVGEVAKVTVTMLQ